MRKNTIKAMLKAGKCVYGTALEDCLGSELPVLLAKAGLDFLWVDTEHSPGDYMEFQALCRSAHYAGIIPLLRVTQNRPELISRGLDNGAMGIIVPRIHSVEAAREALDVMKFPPLGHRGFGLRTIVTEVMERPAEDEIASCNQETMAVLMIESREGLDHVEEIARLPGLDVLFVGPYDLTLSLGIVEQFDDPIFWGAGDRVGAACKAAGIAAGIQSNQIPFLLEARRRGVRFLPYSSEVGMIFSGFKQVVRELRTP